MKVELTELTWLDAQAEYSLVELAERSRLSEAELLELVNCGVISPREPDAASQRFPCQALAAARTAARLRDDFEVDVHGVALAMALLARIDELESELAQLRAPAVR
jgi:chaperone modulatory protein CbpM